jgi:hypothetical protein
VVSKWDNNCCSPPPESRVTINSAACVALKNAVEDLHHLARPDSPLLPSTELTYPAILREKAKKHNVATNSIPTATSSVSVGHTESSESANGNRTVINHAFCAAPLLGIRE